MKEKKGKDGLDKEREINSDCERRREIERGQRKRKRQTRLIERIRKNEGI